MFMEQKRTLSLLVDNTPGLLSRVAGLFSRRGYNIETITAGVTADPRYTRMTVVLYCSDEMTICVTSDDITFEQIKKQLAKLVDVRDIKELKPDESVRRELMLVKIRVNENERRNVIAISDVFRGRIVDVGQESLIVELTGNQSKLEGFLNLVQGYEILELARTGVTGLSRGVHDVRYLD